MKKAVLLMIAVLFTSLLFPVGGNAEEKTFEGRLINLSADFVEVKKKNVERVFYFTPESVIAAAGTEKKVADLRVCQTVRIEYRVANSRKEIVKLEIIKESDCEK
jgi:hypothetical protein